MDGRNVRRERRIADLCNIAVRNHEPNLALFLKYYAHLKWDVTEPTAQAYVRTVAERLSSQGRQKSE